MCVRTKTTYGCGDVYRTIAECRNLDCSGSDKYTFIKDGDCKACRKKGAASTRGRDGLGRYAQEIRRQQVKSRPTSIERSVSAKSLSFEETAPRSPVAPTIIDNDYSPWAEPLTSEKVWETPHRLQADEAWLSEHEARISDLRKRLEEASLSPSLSPAPASSQPATPVVRRQICDVIDDDDNDNEEEDCHAERDTERETERDRDSERHDNAESPKKYVVEFRRRIDDYSCQRSSSGRSYQPEVRQYSHDSLPDSMPSYRSSPRHRTHGSMQYTTTTTTITTTTNTAPSHEYDYYSGSSTPRMTAKRYSGRANTEPYPCSHSTSGHDYDHERCPPVVIDTPYPYQRPRYLRNSDYQYQYPSPGPRPPPYGRFQSRY